MAGILPLERKGSHAESTLGSKRGN